LATYQSRVGKLQADRSAVVAEFLATRLDKGPLLVSELERRAREAGLLGNDQPITHAKPFKKAKMSLGIRSVRSGFGGAGEWLWLLETKSNPPIAEPVAAIGPRAPSAWIEGIGHLHYHHPLADIPPHRWRQFLDDCNNFLTSDVAWAERAATLGWDAIALFGCCRSRPLANLSCAGLLWVINGGRLIELHRDWAVIGLAVNGSERIFQRRRGNAADVLLPWAVT